MTGNFGLATDRLVRTEERHSGLLGVARPAPEPLHHVTE